jgi:hypothetical protein
LGGAYIGGFGGGGFGIGLGLELGTGDGVSLTPGVVPLESVLVVLAGTALFFAIVPERLVLHPSDADTVIATAKQSHKANLFIVYKYSS